jgi:hypothetical protein
MSGPIFAFDLTTPGRLEEMIVKVLAVAGAAALGGLLAGLITQVLARLVAARVVPRAPLNIIRLLGAVVAGWLVALLLFGGGWGGGWGFGGGGGGNGQGSGKGGLSPGTTAQDSSAGKQDKSRDSGKARAGDTKLRVEVLGIPGQSVYRVEGEKELRTIDEIRATIRERQTQPTPLKEVVVVIYRNSPDESKPQVTDLLRLIKELGLTPVKELPERDAP